MNEEQENKSGTATDIGGTQPNQGEQGQSQDTKVEGSQAKSYTDEQLNAMFKDRVDRAKKSTEAEILKAYGVGSREELDSLVSAGKKEPEYKSALEKSAQGKEQVAFVLNGIDPEMEEDIRFFFKGKGVELTTETLKAELEGGKHRHWKKQEQAQISPKQDTAQPAQPQKQGVTITEIGSSKQNQDAEYAERREKFLAAAGVKIKK